MGLSPGRVNPKTIKLVFAAFQLNTQHYGVRTRGRRGRNRMVVGFTSTCTYSISAYHH